MPEINKTGGNSGGGVVAAMGVEWAWLEARTFVAKVILKGLEEESLKADQGEVSKDRGQEVGRGREVKLGKAMEKAEMEMKGAKEEMELKAAMEEAEAVVKAAMEAN